MLKQTAILVLITFIPALELRASIPWGIFGNESWGVTPGLMNWPTVVLICAAANILLGWAVFWLLAPALKLLGRIPLFQRHIEPLMLRAQNRIKPYVDRYGELGVALFIGIPLPGSGVYTGAVGAFLLGLDRRKFAVANVIGVGIAATAVTIISLAIRAGVDMPWLEWIVKH